MHLGTSVLIECGALGKLSFPKGVPKALKCEFAPLYSLGVGGWYLKRFWGVHGPLSTLIPLPTHIGPWMGDIMAELSYRSICQIVLSVLTCYLGSNWFYRRYQ